jgi:hypothetical protein
MGWAVPREWGGETCFLLGGGPSLRNFDASVLRGRRVIAINRSFRLAPWADVLYFCDRTWWLSDGAEVLRDFTGKYIVTIAAVKNEPRIRILENSGPGGLELAPTGLRHGTNSGFQSINLAFHFGARRIVLLGFDQKIEGNATHWHGGYGVAPEVVHHAIKARMLPYFPTLVEPLKSLGVEVWNATPGSALDCWPRVELAEILADTLEAQKGEAA